MNSNDKVAAYIEKHQQWASIFTQLRTIFNQTGLKEDIKWGSPAYSWQGKLVAGYSGFKNHCAIWFFQGVFLRDPQKVLVNAQEGVTKGLRQWRFNQGDIIDKQLVRAYLDEAIANCKDGKEIRPTRNKKPVELPGELDRAFAEDTQLARSFERLSPGKQREYAKYILETKQETTRNRRLEKISPMIKQGKGLNDRYR